MIHEAQVQLDTTAIMAYMFIAGIVGFLMDRMVLVLEDSLLRWKRGGTAFRSGCNEQLPVGSRRSAAEGQREIFFVKTMIYGKRRDSI